MYCTRCGRELSEQAAFCPNCGQPRVRAGAPQAVATSDAAARQTEPLAVASLVSGILGLSLLPGLASVLALVLGFVARANIRKQPHLQGGGMATAGIILGVVGIAVVVFLIVLFLVFINALSTL